MKIVIAGDFCDRFRVSQKIKDKQYNECFDGIKPIVSGADFGIVNLEFPITIGDSEPIVKCGPSLKGQKESIDAIKYVGFNVCTLANNHILDQGAECCLGTKSLLEQSGIKTVGVGNNIKDASASLYLRKEQETLAVINCCEHEFSQATEKSAGANPLNPVRQYYAIQRAREKADYVLVIVHGGHEHYQLPSPRMVETYRYFVDCGADAVINIHQHCYSGYEVYNGCPIFYGLGNFCFDDPRHTSGDIWNYGYMVSLDFQKKATSFTIHPYSQCTKQAEIINLALEAFDKQIEALNAIISNPDLLREKTDDYFEKSMSMVEFMLNPYQSRFMRGLVKYHILPSLFTSKWLVKMYDYIMCESHRDKVEYFISKRLKKE